MESPLTNDEMDALRSLGWRIAGGGLYDGVLKVGGVKDGNRELKTRAEWRAIIQGMPRVSLQVGLEETQVLRLEVERLGRIISALVEDAAGGEIMIPLGRLASARPITINQDGEGRDDEMTITVLA